MRNMYRAITGGDPSSFVALKLRVPTKNLIQGLVPDHRRLDQLGYRPFIGEFHMCYICGCNLFSF